MDWRAPVWEVVLSRVSMCWLSPVWEVELSRVSMDLRATVCESWTQSGQYGMASPSLGKLDSVGLAWVGWPQSGKVGLSRVSMGWLALVWESWTRSG